MKNSAHLVHWTEGKKTFCGKRSSDGIVVSFDWDACRRIQVDKDREVTCALCATRAEEIRKEEKAT